MCFATTHMLIKSSIWTWCFSDSGRNGLLNPMLPNNVAVAFSYSKFSSGPYFVDLPLRIVKPRIVHYWREISICWSSTCPGSLRSRSCWGRFCDFAIGFAQNDMRKEDMPRKMKIHQTGLEPEKSEINLSGKSFSKVLRLNEIFAIHWIVSWMKWT